MDCWIRFNTFFQVERFNDNGSIKEKAPNEFKEHHLNERSSIISPVDLARKIEEYEDVKKTFQKKVPWSYSKDAMKKKWKNPMVIPRKNISMNNLVHTREHKNRNNHQDFEKRRRPTEGSFTNLAHGNYFMALKSSQ
ncbi:hypothetical protein TNCV_481301 [Trichonephila clavipes]|nr:hypothetical protein TNCV_481301 [Trichonephila clavipes]